jgi:hypothetical protein
MRLQSARKLSAMSATLRFGVAAVALLMTTATAEAQSVTFQGSTFTNLGLQGVGRLSAAQRDRFGETFGSLSAMALDLRSWRRNGDSYNGTLYGLPDRGFNIAGTTNYQPRVNIIGLSFTPYTGTANLPVGASQQNQVQLTLQNTILLRDNAGQPMTGLDPSGANTFRAAAGGFPNLPMAANGRLALDAEGIVLNPDGSFYISDEYGPYTYKFSADGQLQAAIRPPAALIPIRNGVENYSSNNPTVGVAAPTPGNPVTGRQNNQGLEGLTVTPDRRRLVALLQSATRQDGGEGGTSPNRRNTRMLVYDIAANASAPPLLAEYVVQLPTYQTAAGATRVAAQSELFALNDTQFLLLSRDGAGLGVEDPLSLYRRVDLIDITGATNIAGTAFSNTTTPVAPGGALNATVTPVRFQSFININDNAQLAKFGLRNGAPNDRNNLSEKWEALAVASTLDNARPDDFFLFVGNDNDFQTRNGFQVGAPYDAGVDNDTLLLAYRVTLPTYLDPLALDQMKASGAAFADALGVSAWSMAKVAARDSGGRLFGLRTGMFDDRKAGSAEIFVTGNYFDAQRRVGSGLAESQADGWNISFGGDYAFTDHIRGGFAVGYIKGDGDYDTLGSADQSAWTFSPYVSAGWGGFYGDLAYTYMTGEADDLTRNAGVYGLAARGETDVGGHIFAANVGYSLELAGLRIGPVASLTALDIKVDDFTEENAVHLNLAYGEQKITSTIAHLGLALSLPGELFVPQARLGYDFSLNDGDRTIDLRLANRTAAAAATNIALPALEGEGFRIGGGVGLKTGPLTWVLDVDTKFKKKGYDETIVGASVRFGF